MSSLSIYLLGPPRLERDGVAVHFARRRTLAFTLYLAVTGEPHHRERLTSLFWPESEPGRARASLRRALYQINQTLGEGWIETEGDTVRFADNGALWLDVDQFRRSMAACREHGHASETVCHDCLPLLAEAVGLYRNDFLAGFSLRDSPEFDDWQFFQGETLRDELALALERLVHGHTALEQYPQAIAYARRRLALDVLHEPAHRWLMQLYAWHGRHAAALCQYEQCVRLLAEEMDVPPAPETEQLYQAIKARRLPPLLSRAGAAGSDGGASAEQRVDDDIRVVTVLCAGLADAESMESAAALDSLAAAMQVLQSIVVEACTPLGGRVEPAAGEAFLVLFGVNQGHEDDAERGIRAAAAIRRQALLQGLAVQIGLDTGLAYCRRQASPHETSLQATMMNAAVMGPVVNLATRLHNRAAPGEILVGRSAYLAARGLCDYAEMMLSLPGLAKQLPAFSVERLRPQPIKERGLAGFQAQLVGRDAEMVLLHDLLDRVRAGEGGVVAVAGEAGVGKSRLVAELRAACMTDNLAHASDAPVPLWLEGRALAFAADIGNWIFADLLRSHFGVTDRHALAQKLSDALFALTQDGHLSATEVEEIGPLLGLLLSAQFDNDWDVRLQHVAPDQVRRRTLAAIRRFLMALAQVRPLVLVLEDLHWADPHSLDLIASLIGEIERSQMLLLGLYRPEGSQQDRPLARFAQRMVPARFVELHLDGLTPAQSRLMVKSLLGDERLPDVAVEPILTRTEGNPLFVEEVVRSLIEARALVREEGRWHWRGDGGESGVPITLRSIVYDRVGRLDGAARHTLQGAAIFGRVFRPRLLSALLSDVPRIEKNLADLVKHAFIYRERTLPEPEYSFRHVLVQEAVYQSLPQGRRTTLHHRAGEAIETTYAKDLEAYTEQLAHHYELGGDREKAITYLLQSGRNAQRIYLNDSALAYFQRALALVDGLEENEQRDRHRLGALRGLGEVYAVLGNLAAAEPALRQAMALAVQLELPPAEQVRLYFPLCQLLRWLGRFEALFALGQEGLVILGEDAESAEAVMLITFLATGIYQLGRRRQCRRLTGSVIEPLRRLAFGPHLTSAYGAASWWYRDGKRTAEAIVWIHELEVEAQRCNDLWLLGHLHAWPGYWLPEAVGDSRTIWANMRSVSAIAEETGDQVLLGYASTYLGHLYWGFGDLERAEAMYRQALELHTKSQALHMCVLDRIGIGWVRLCHSDVSGAIAALEPALSDAAALRYRVHGVQMGRLALATAYLRSSRRQEAVDLYQMVALEDEADSDGLVWIASALTGLERVLDDPIAFQAVCRHIKASRRSDDPLPLVEWQLKPAQPDVRVVAAHTPVFLEQSDMSPAWRWADPYDDSSFAVVDGGLLIYASNYFRDLWFNNLSAPRLMHATRGDFALEARCVQAVDDRPALGGLVLWADERNFLRLDWNIDGLGSVSLRGSIDGQDVLLGRGLLSAGDPAFLRLERSDNYVRALCSADGKGWFSVAEVRFAAGASIEVGIFASGLINRYVHAGAYPEGSAIRFEAIVLTLEERLALDAKVALGSEPQ